MLNSLNIFVSASSCSDWSDGMIGVTGASGFIGAHLLAQLGNSGFQIDLRALDTPN